MRGKPLLATAILCTTIILFTLVPRTQAYELKTTYIIEIHEDGTASWTIEQSAYLQSEDDRTNFSQLTDRAFVYIDQFSYEVATLISNAYDKTGRLMALESPPSVEYNITSAYVGAYGSLKYSFNWPNFAVVQNETITIGDTFSNETFMFGNGALSLILPAGYYVKSCSPPPDYQLGNVLTWNTTNGFRDGEPAILLSKEEVTLFPPELPIAVATSVTILGVFLSSVLVLKIRKRKKENIIETTSEEPSREMDDTEKILALIKSAGGQMLQSKITEQLRCSKAKTSKILADMENKGIIKRFKRGRDKVVSPKGNEKGKN